MACAIRCRRGVDAHGREAATWAGGRRALGARPGRRSVACRGGCRWGEARAFGTGGGSGARGRRSRRRSAGAEPAVVAQGPDQEATRTVCRLIGRDGGEADARTVVEGDVDMRPTSARGLWRHAAVTRWPGRRRRPGFLMSRCGSRPGGADRTPRGRCGGAMAEATEACAGEDACLGDPGEAEFWACREPRRWRRRAMARRMRAGSVGWGQRRGRKLRWTSPAGPSSRKPRSLLQGVRGPTPQAPAVTRPGRPSSTMRCT